MLFFKSNIKRYFSPLSSGQDNWT